MRKSILIILFTLLGVLSAQAYDFEVDGIAYNIIGGVTNDVMVVSSDVKYSGSVVVPATVRYGGTTYIVTTIGDEAFRDCSGLTSVTIPNSVTSIGNSAFRSCNGLISMTISVNVTSIGNEAFRDCSGLTSVTIPNRVTCISEGAFSGCSGLTSVNIPESVTTIGDGAFSNCSGLTSVSIPESVTSIGNCTFLQCNSLKSVQWNALHCQNLSYSYHSPFYNIASLTSITFGSEVEHIPSYLCFGCSGLTSVTIPNSVTSIGDGAFYNCPGLTSVTIPNSVTSIGYRAFIGCSGLTSVTIPNSVTTIGGDAFRVCSGLTSVTIGENVTSIGGAAFRDCSGLTSVIIPASVTSIGGYAFDGCSNLTSVTSLAQTPPSCGSRVFSVYDTLFVPRGCKAAYQTAPKWEEFAVIKETPCLVTLPVNNEVMGSVSGDGEYAYGAQATLEAVPNTGYHFVKWSDGLTDNLRTLTVTRDTAFTAEFAPNIYTVTAQANDADMGTVSGGDTYAFGSSDTLEAVPNTGYHFVKWNDENTDNPRVLTVSCDTAFTAEFAINTYTVTAQPNDAAMGSVVGGNTYAFGAEATLEAIPNTGYHFVKWSDGNTDNPRVLTVSCDTTFTAEFAINTYTVTAQVNDADMGSVVGGNTYAFGSSATLEAIPNEGYHFVKWDDEYTDNPRTLTVTQDTTFTAEFAINTFTVGISANNEAWGSVSQSGNGTYDSASSVTITATPNEGYRFIHWTKGNEVFTTDSLHTFVITENLALVANFEKIPDEPVVLKTFTVSVSANNEAWGSVSQSGDGTYDSAFSVTITATPNEGYRFLNWTKGEVIFSTHADTTFKVTENLTLVANFEKIPDTPTANENLEADNFRVYVQDRTIHLSENRGLVQVYNMAGQCVYNGRATAIPVQHAGVYILRVADGRSRKVLVR